MVSNEPHRVGEVSARRVLAALGSAGLVTLLLTAAVAAQSPSPPPALPSEPPAPASGSLPAVTSEQPAAVTGGAQTPAAPPLAPAVATTAEAVDEALKRSCVQVAKAYTDMADSFAADPAAFLNGFAQRGSSAAVPVRNVLVARPAAIAALMDVVERDPRSEQSRQIVLGIGQATLMCANAAPQVALRFQQAIARAGDPIIRSIFAAATGDTATAAIGGGGNGGAAGPTGGPAISASPSIGTFGAAPGDEGTPQTAGTYDSNGSSALLFGTDDDDDDSDGDACQVVSPNTFC